MTRELCNTKCPRYAFSTRCPCMQGAGPKPSSIMIVGRDPCQKDDLVGTPFHGPAGRLLDDILMSHGFDRESVYITNAVKCAHPDKTKEPGKKEIKYCKEHLLREIKEVNPQYIFVLGGVALEMVTGRTGIMKIQNTVLDSTEFNAKVLPMVHPSFVLRDPGNRKYIEKGFDVAVQLVQGEPTKSSSKYLVATTEEQCHKILDKLLQCPVYSFDIETSSLEVLKSKVLCVSFSWEFGTGVVIPWKFVANSLDIFSKMKAVFKTTAIKIGHNVKFDMQHLMKTGMCFKSPFFDTMVAHSLIDDNSLEHNLGALVLRYTDMGEYWDELEKFKKEYCKTHGIKDKDFSYENVPEDSLYQYAAKDADATFRLHGIFDKELKEEEQYDFFVNHSMKFLPVLLEMEYRGIKINREKVQELIVRHTKEKEELGEQIKKDDLIKQYEEYKTKKVAAKNLKELKIHWQESATLVSRFPEFATYAKSREPEVAEHHTFNMSSPVQLRELFFEMLGLKTIKETKTKQPSTDKEVMEVLAEEHDIPLATLMDKYRKVEKFLDTFLIPTYEKSASDGRIHTSYMQADVVTGRLCVSADTEVETNKGLIQIQHIEVGETVLTHTGQYKSVLNKYYKGMEEMFHVRLLSGGSIKCTKEHRFLSDKGWVSAAECVSKMGTDDEVLFATPQSGYAPMYSYEPCGVQGVWDIEVGEDHSYVSAGGFINHNSSRNPNLQNLPREAKEFKSCFVADEGWVFVKADLAQAEFRVWAAVSNDLDMINDIEGGLDIHKHTASEVFGISLDEVTDFYRNVAKRGTFGMMYGIGPKKLARQFKISIFQAENINKVFANKYPVATEWIRDRVGFARSEKYVLSWFGRKRRLPAIDSDDQNMRAKAERQAMNSPIQGMASDCNNLYMVNSLRALRKAKIECYPVMTTHDENVFSVREHDVPEVVRIVEETVHTSIPSFGCRMDVDCKVGDTIGTAIKYENTK